MTRQVLPNRRAHEVVDLEHDGHVYVVSIARFEDGRPAEVHINSARVGSTLDTHGQDIAALISLLLQSGVGVSTIEQSHRSSGVSLVGRVVRFIGGGA